MRFHTTRTMTGRDHDVSSSTRSSADWDVGEGGGFRWDYEFGVGSLEFSTSRARTWFELNGPRPEAAGDQPSGLRGFNK